MLSLDRSVNASHICYTHVHAVENTHTADGLPHSKSKASASVRESIREYERASMDASIASACGGTA